MNQKLTEKLKPCPFCGRKPRVFRAAMPRHIEYQVACPFKTCLVQPMTGWREEKKDCIADWNIRNEVKNG